MNQHAPKPYDPAHGKRIAPAVTPLAAVIAFVLGLREGAPWWSLLPAAVVWLAVAVIVHKGEDVDRPTQ